MYSHDTAGFAQRLQTPVNFFGGISAAPSCPVHDLPDGSRNSPLVWAETQDPRCNCRLRPVRRVFAEEAVEVPPDLEIVLVRHGERIDKVDAFYSARPDARPADPPLTALGELQARCAASAVRAEDVTAVYVSPFLRCVQTAAVMVQAWSAERGTPPRVFVHAGLAELLFPRWFTAPPQLLPLSQLRRDVCAALEDTWLPATPRAGRRLALAPASDRRVDSPITALAAVSLTEERDVDVVRTPVAALPVPGAAEIEPAVPYGLADVWPETRSDAAARVAAAVRALSAEHRAPLSARPDRALTDALHAAVQDHTQQNAPRPSDLHPPHEQQQQQQQSVGVQQQQQSVGVQQQQQSVGVQQQSDDWAQRRRRAGCPVIVLVTHAGCIAAAVAALAGSHLNGSQVRYCAVTRLVSRGGRWTAETLNSTEHLTGMAAPPPADKDVAIAAEQVQSPPAGAG